MQQPGPRSEAEGQVNILKRFIAAPAILAALFTACSDGPSTPAAPTPAPLLPLGWTDVPESVNLRVGDETRFQIRLTSAVDAEFSVTLKDEKVRASGEQVRTGVFGVTVVALAEGSTEVTVTATAPTFATATATIPVVVEAVPPMVISGTVRERNAGTIEGAVVSVIDPVTEEVEGGDITDRSGRFRVDELEGDRYRVEVVALGYERVAARIVERTRTLHEFNISFTLDPVRDPAPTIDSRFRRWFWDEFAFDMFDCPDEDACPDYYRDGSGPLPLEERLLYVLPSPSPNIYIRTERENGERGFSSSQIRTLRRVMPRAIADLTGEPFTGQITEGSAHRDRDGWITVVAVRSADDPEEWGRDDDGSILCGRARIGWPNGLIRLNLDGIRSTPTDGYCWLESITRHEIGHAMGFFHVDGSADVMAIGDRGHNFSSRERYHGQLAYQLERYTRYADGPAYAGGKRDPELRLRERPRGPVVSCRHRP